MGKAGQGAGRGRGRPPHIFFIAEMEGNLDGFIAPEIVKRKVPMIVVTDDKEADYVLTGGSIRGDDKWYHTIFGGKDKNEGNVHVGRAFPRRTAQGGGPPGEETERGSVRAVG